MGNLGIKAYTEETSTEATRPTNLKVRGKHEPLHRHSALSYGHVADGLSIPQELTRRDDRLAAIAEAKIEARAAERFAREQADYEAKLAARAQRAAATGNNPRGKPPQAPEPGRRSGDQINFTDEASPIMPIAGGGFEQCDNAQAGVDNETMLVLAPQVAQALNDKQQVAPMLERVQALPAGLNQPEQLLADAGYFSAENLAACEQAGIEPLIAVQREYHHPHWSERFSEPPDLPGELTPCSA